MAALTFTAKEAKTRSRLSPQFNTDKEGPKSTRYWLVGWDDIEKTDYEFLGWPEYLGPGQLSRHIPQRDPLKQNLWAVSCNTDELLGTKGYETVTVDGQNVNIAKWNETAGSVLRVDYSWLPYEIFSDDDLPTTGEYGRYVEKQEDGQCDILTSSVFTQMFKWAAPEPVDSDLTQIAGTPAVNLGISKVIPYANVTMIWYQVPYRHYPRTTIQNSYGKVSSVDLGSPGKPDFYAKGTLLFLGCRRRRYFSPHPEFTQVGQQVVDLQYFFRHDPGGDTNFDPDNIGPNTFPCFASKTAGPFDAANQGIPLNRRLLITDNGSYKFIGNRTGSCVYDEFDPTDLFKVVSA